MRGRGPKEREAALRPRLYIKVRPGLDFAGRTGNLWAGKDPNGFEKTYGAVWLIPLHEAIQSYVRRWRRMGVAHALISEVEQIREQVRNDN